VYKSEHPLHCNEDVRRHLLRRQIFFYVLSRSKVPQQSIDSLSCRVGCEFITITISIARREAAENFLSLDGLHWLTSYYDGARTMQSDQLLVACPKCHAWPMAVHAGKRRWASEAPMVRFTCPKCGHQEEERLGGSYAKRESTQQHEIAGGGF
jgi:DNA-directed RNA polymerase subunit M/transcription elongation factor TFIIS